MPLTLREFEQVQAAIDAMHGYSIADAYSAGGQMYIMAHNVKALLSRWVDDPKPAKRGIGCDPKVELN